MITIKSGYTRLVILIGPFAFKLPHFGRGWRMGLTGMLSNMTEAKFSTLKSPYLCPVRFSIPGGFLVVMDRAEPLSEEAFEALQEEGFFGDKFFHAEIKRCSFGWLKNVTVAVDYGEAYLSAGSQDLEKFKLGVTEK
jgi:hypothetical protein